MMPLNYVTKLFLYSHTERVCFIFFLTLEELVCPSVQAQESSPSASKLYMPERHTSVLLNK